MVGPMPFSIHRYVLEFSLNVWSIAFTGCHLVFCLCSNFALSIMSGGQSSCGGLLERDLSE